MASLAIPAKISSSSVPVGYDTAIDASYGVYNAQLKNYPVANAFVDGSDTSQEKRGLQVSARTAQNNVWKTQLTFGVGSGSGAFALNSISYPFTRSINKIESGNVQTGFYQNGLATITFDETNSKIGNVNLNPTTDITTGTQGLNGFVATSGGNKFLCVVSGRILSVYPMDVNYKITSTTPTGTYTMPTNVNESGAPVAYGIVIAAIGQYCWIAEVEGDSGGTVSRAGCWGYLISISSLGVPTLVGSGVQINNYAPGGSGNSGSNYGRGGIGAYVINNTAHLFSEAQAGGATTNISATSYDTIDLTNTTAFTKTNVRQTNSTTNARSGILSGSMVVGYDGTGLLIVTNLGTPATPDIYRIVAGSYTDQGVDYISTYASHCRYRNTASKLSTAASNININAAGTGFSIKGVAHTGTLANLRTKHIWIFEMSGSNEQDDAGAFKGVYVPCGAIGSSITSGVVTLKLNGVLIGTKENILNPVGSSTNMNFTLSPITVGQTKLIFLLEYSNLNAQDSKLGFGLTGGTYASPTGNYETSTINLVLV